MTSIQLGSLTFPAFATGGWFFRNLTDWYTLTDDKSPQEERPQGHGAFGVGASWRSSAAVSFQAVWTGESHAALLTAQEQLAAIGAEGPVTMTVTDDLRDTSRRVTVKSTRVPDSHGQKTLTYDIDCLARDPRRYGAEETSVTGLPTSGTGLVFPVTYPVSFGTPGDPGRITLTNRGTAPTAPTLVVSGGVGSFTLTEIESGKRLVFGRAIPVGSSVALNGRTRQAVIDGQSNVTGYITSRQWWTIQPGATSTVQFTATAPVGSPTLTGIVQPAWW